MTDLIAEAITAHYGERCPDFEPECWCCKAWASYDRLLAGAEWQPIETIPGDGTLVQVYAPAGVTIMPAGPLREATRAEKLAVARATGQIPHRQFIPTHWMHLPAPPAALSPAEGEGK